jgi:hypothetical protein
MKTSERSTFHKHKVNADKTECGKNTDYVKSSPIIPTRFESYIEIACDECWDTYDLIR